MNGNKYFTTTGTNFYFGVGPSIPITNWNLSHTGPTYDHLFVPPREIRCQSCHCGWNEQNLWDAPEHEGDPCPTCQDTDREPMPFSEVWGDGREWKDYCVEEGLRFDGCFYFSSSSNGFNMPAPAGGFFYLMGGK